MYILNSNYILLVYLTKALREIIRNALLLNNTHHQANCFFLETSEGLKVFQPQKLREKVANLYKVNFKLKKIGLICPANIHNSAKGAEELYFTNFIDKL